MFEVGEIIVVPMDDDGAVLDLTGVVSVRGLSADGYSKSEGEETDAGHQLYNYADEPHFFTPGPLERNTKAGIQHVRIKQYIIHGPFVTNVSALFAIFISPQSPIISSSCTMHETIRVIESGETFVSASTHSTSSYRSADPG